MSIALWSIGLILIYTATVGLAMKVVTFTTKLRADNSFDLPEIVFLSVLWPLTFPVLSLAKLSKLWYWMFDMSFNVLKKLIKRANEVKCVRAAKIPEIVIPDGAFMTSAAYRKLKPMIQEFEQSIPVTERE